MSRICGIFSRLDRWPQDALTSVLNELARPAWERRILKDGPTSLAAAGWRSPVVAQRGSLIAVIDGAFFNRHELPDGANDADRLLSLYGRIGFESALRQVNGDFALALWDGGRGNLLIARDRIGLKPLYYHLATDRTSIAFASRPDALLRLPRVDRQVNRHFVARFAASHYRTFDNDPETSPYQFISQLPAGCLLEVTSDGIKQRRWWQLEAQEDFTSSFDELAERYRHLLLDAVKTRLNVVDKPAFTLSGGMDSSSVVGCAVAGAGRKQHAYSSVYVDRTFDESEDIRPMLRDHVERWHPVELGNTIDVLAIASEMVALHGEPVATATWLSHYLITKDVSSAGFDSLFGGMGGDELNAGEYEYFVCHFSDLARAGKSAELEQEITQWVAHHDHPIYRKTRDVAFSEMARLCDPDRPGVVLPDRRRLARYLPTLNPDFVDLSQWLPEMEHPFASYLKNRTYQDMFRETAPCCLRAEDRHCTAAALDRFDPFFDYRLAELMFRVRGTDKIGNGTTKLLLRAAMKGILPEETRTRVKKTGWNAPAHVWFAGSNLSAIRDLVSSRGFRERGIYNPAEVERLVADHAAIVENGEARENHAMFLWQLVNVEMWLQRHDTL